MAKLRAASDWRREQPRSLLKRTGLAMKRSPSAPNAQTNARRLFAGASLLCLAAALCLSPTEASAQTYSDAGSSGGYQNDRPSHGGGHHGFGGGGWIGPLIGIGA